MSTRRTEIGEQRRARTRERLVTAALAVFARLGPDAPQIDDFVSEAGVARGTFYNYFDTVEALRVAVAVHMTEQMRHDMGYVRGLADPAARVGGSMRRYMHRAAADPVFGWAIVRIALVAAPLGPTMRKFLAADVDAGMQCGRFSCASRQAAYDVILGSAIMGMRSVLEGTAPAGHAEAVAAMALTALGVGDAEAVARVAIAEGAVDGGGGAGARKRGKAGR